MMRRHPHSSDQFVPRPHPHHHVAFDHEATGVASGSHHLFPNSVPGSPCVSGDDATPRDHRPRYVAAYQRQCDELAGLAGYHSPGREVVANPQMPSVAMIGHYHDGLDVTSDHHGTADNALGSGWNSRGFVIANQHNSRDEILQSRCSPHDEVAAIQHHSPYEVSANQLSPSDDGSANHYSSEFETVRQHNPPRETTNQHRPSDEAPANHHTPVINTPANQHNPSGEFSANQHNPSEEVSNSQYSSVYETANQHNAPDKTSNQNSLPADSSANQHIPPHDIPANQHTPPADTPANQRSPTHEIPANDVAPPDEPTNQNEASDNVTLPPSRRDTRSPKTDPLKSEIDPNQGQSENSGEDSEKIQEKPFAFSHYLYNYLRSVKNIPPCESE